MGAGRIFEPSGWEGSPGIPVSIRRLAEMTTQLTRNDYRTPDSAPGLLVVDGQQKTFTLEGVWKSPVAPAVNMAVRFEFDGAGSIRGLTVVDPQQAAREKLEADWRLGPTARKGRRGDRPPGSRGTCRAHGEGHRGLRPSSRLDSWFFFPGVDLSVENFSNAARTKSLTLSESPGRHRSEYQSRDDTFQPRSVRLAWPSGHCGSVRGSLPPESEGQILYAGPWSIW